MSPLLARSKHVVYTNVVEALLRFVLVNKGYMLLHSATVQLGDETIMLSAQTDTGKTGTILRLLQEHPEQLGLPVRRHDDRQRPTGDALVLPEAADDQLPHAARGQHQGLSRPQRLVLAVQSRIHSKDGRQFALLLARLNIPIIAINAITQILVPPPKYMVDRLVPTVTYQRRRHGRPDLHHRARRRAASSRCPHDEAIDDAAGEHRGRLRVPAVLDHGARHHPAAEEPAQGQEADIATLRSRERAILEDFLGTHARHPPDLAELRLGGHHPAAGRPFPTADRQAAMRPRRSIGDDACAPRRSARFPRPEVAT